MLRLLLLFFLSPFSLPFLARNTSSYLAPSPRVYFWVRLLKFKISLSPDFWAFAYQVSSYLHLSCFNCGKSEEWSSAALRLLPPNSLTRAHFTASTLWISPSVTLSHIAAQRVSEMAQPVSSINVTYSRFFWETFLIVTYSCSETSAMTPQTSIVFIC